MDSVNCAPRKRSRPSHFDAAPFFVAAVSVFITPEPGMSLTQYGLGEPIALFEGVSIWPTGTLRVLGVLLSLYSIWICKALLEKNLKGLAMDRKLTHAL